MDLEWPDQHQLANFATRLAKVSSLVPISQIARKEADILDLQYIRQ